MKYGNWNWTSRKKKKKETKNKNSSGALFILNFEKDIFPFISLIECPDSPASKKAGIDSRGMHSFGKISKSW